MSSTLRAAASGVLAAAAGVAVAELFAAATHPQAGPVVAVGSAVIDATPTPVKEFAVRTFGTYDKPLLLGGIAVGLALFAVVLGILGYRRLWLGLAGAGVFGLVGVSAALSRPAAGPLDALPSLLGALVAAGVLWRLVAVPSSASPRSPLPAMEVPAGRPPRLLDRRSFVGTAVITATGTALVAGGALGVRRVRGGAAARSRDAVRLPAAADRAKALPAGVGPDFYTANADFYRVDTALTVPRVDIDSWRLTIKGTVDRPVELSFADLLRRPLVERDITLNCVSNEVGGPYIGTARWLGVPLAPLLREAGIRAGSDQIVARSVEGMTIGTPVETVLDGRDAMLCVGMNGAPLPLEHGFPVRMLTPGLYGYAGACKWVTSLEVSTFDKFDAYWVERGWAARGPVKTAARIDRPASFARVGAGNVTIAGVAWAQRRGIAAVEVQVDDGPWRTASLAPVPSTDTWVQWRYEWAATPGAHTLRVRATDSTGATQTENRAEPFPDGATGWHTLAVTVNR